MLTPLGHRRALEFGPNSTSPSPGSLGKVLRNRISELDLDPESRTCNCSFGAPCTTRTCARRTEWGTAWT